jgi:hypothetical protein
MAASNTRYRSKRSAGWRLFVNGRMVLGATTLEALAKCTAIEIERRAGKYDAGPECTAVMVSTWQEFEERFGPTKD